MNDESSYWQMWPRINLFRVLQQEYHRLHSLNNRNLFLTVLETGKTKSKKLADSVSDKVHYLVHR